MSYLLELPEALKFRRYFMGFDDFEWYISPHRWTSLAVDGGASVAIVAAGRCGLARLTTGATDNNEAALKMTNEPFKMIDGKPIFGETTIQYAEANTDDANVAFGFADSFGADLLVDDGAGPKASFSGALLYKVKNSTVWKFITSKGTTRNITTTDITAGGSSQVRLGIDLRPLNSTTFEAIPYIDGVHLLDPSQKRPTPIKHTITITSAAAMSLGVYVKAGGANSEVVDVDYVGWSHLR